MFKVNDMVDVQTNGKVVKGTILEGRQWIQTGGQSATKHCPISTATMGWGYRVRYPIVLKDGTPFMVRGEHSMGISYVSETLLSAQKVS